MRKRTGTRRVDTMISAYVEWREASRLVHDAYRGWASATGLRARAAFWRCMAALDAQEWAAQVYASLGRRVRHQGASDGDLSGQLAA
jgi:hypothetical protein